MSRASICRTPRARGNCPPESAHTTNGVEFGDIIRKVVGQKALHVSEGSVALLHGGDDGREVVVQQHEVGSFMGHVRARAADSNAYICLLERRAVVNPVAGHGNDVPP